MQLNTPAYHLLIQKQIPFLLKQQNTEIEITQAMDAAKNITQEAIKVFENQNIQRRSKCSYTINCYRTTSNILINGPYNDSFLSNEMKTVIDILEQKIQIQSTNSHLKKILFNTITNNPTTTISSTDSISEKQITSEGKEMDNPTKDTQENNNLLDPKEKEMQVNKSQSQNVEKELYTDRLNLNENMMSDSLLSCSQSKKNDHEFMIECSECKAWTHYQCTELPLYMIASLVKSRKKILIHFLYKYK